MKLVLMIGTVSFIIFLLISVWSLFAYRQVDQWQIEEVETIERADDLGLYQVESGVSRELLYTFNVDGTLEETSMMDESPSQYFWVNSGAKLIIEQDKGRTLQGQLAQTDTWHERYAASNARETQGGDYPQNLFRLLTRSTWRDVKQEVELKITRIHPVDAVSRDAFSGLFLMARYADADNLYYGGIRMDGHAVIKKKIAGVYYTLAEILVVTADTPYDRDQNPNLLPLHQWMKLGLNVRNDGDAVALELWFSGARASSTVLVLQARDEGVYGQPLAEPGYGGIRTDFADVWFDNYRLTDLAVEIN